MSRRKGENRPGEGAAPRRGPRQEHDANASLKETTGPSFRSPCPDCGTQFDSKRRLLHEPTCPIARSLNDTSEADRLWFDAHPNATEYRRPMGVCDRDAVLRGVGAPLPEGFRLVGKVRVVSMGPGLRGRDYSGIFAIQVPR